MIIIIITIILNLDGKISNNYYDEDKNNYNYTLLVKTASIISIVITYNYQKYLNNYNNYNNDNNDYNNNQRNNNYKNKNTKYNNYNSYQYYNIE